MVNIFVAEMVREAKCFTNLCRRLTKILYKIDNMPNILWIWQVKTLQCYNIILFKHPIRQAIWNPREEHMLLTICGDENLHIIQPTDNDEIEIMPLRVPLCKHIY
jgi:hypothetical protein